MLPHSRHYLPGRGRDVSLQMWFWISFTCIGAALAPICEPQISPTLVPFYGVREENKAHQKPSQFLLAPVPRSNHAALGRLIPCFAGFFIVLSLRQALAFQWQSNTLNLPHPQGWPGHS
ncbi:uncharacterized protein BDZ83DRAFT_628887 [Colletotrichum acutatum]|uniref:Uncharacterized protein n=1 Tax=Glomerella acutata TaxID=27357 RepID=A0AAD8UEN5_GLOAC|nr:uncharacterized protein BDZ83DRAFT_628887 [Colletotrichum acutatum]KAK1722526.1 hypothetical protein BDZ83DRAFT_628887 [Colletotrichum acutatum]